MLSRTAASARTPEIRPGQGPAVVLRRPGQSRRAVAGNPAPAALAARFVRGHAGQPRPQPAGRRRAPAPGPGTGQPRTAPDPVRRRPRRAAGLVARTETAAPRPRPRLGDGACRPGAALDPAPG